MTGRRSKLVILGLILLTAWLRLWQLNSIPSGLWFDEGFNGMEVFWMLKTQAWPLFILGGQGREVLFFYLLVGLTSWLGDAVYVLRLAPALLGILSIPLMYRWALTVFKGERAAVWMALIGTAGLAVSFWLQVMNRVSYRANTLLPVLLLTGYFFWRGWQSGQLRYYGAAGVGLGLCQYTYLAGRLVPLVFAVFVLVQTGLNRKSERVRLKVAWLGLVIMTGVAILMFLPMVSVFIRYPELFWERSGDVALELNQTSQGEMLTLTQQMLAAVQVFGGGEDPNWRHHLLGRPVFEWFSTVGFWVGLAIIIKQLRRPTYSFLCSILLVMWLPALLAKPAFHTLRLVGILPAYYTLMALGWLSSVEWLQGKFRGRLATVPAGGMVLGTVLLLNGGVNSYDYFQRWAGRPEVYQAFETPVVELGNYLAASETESNLIIPFYLYAHASLRYTLHDHFREAVVLPGEIATSLRQAAKVSVVIPEYPTADSLPPAWVWLAKDRTKRGTAYISAVRRDISLAKFTSEAGQLIKDSRGQVMARLYQVDPNELLPFFPQQLPQKKSAVAWANNLGLTGYQFTPAIMEAGSGGNLLLSWKILSYTGLKEKMFFQLLNSRGQPVGQQEIEPISRKMYRWREDGLILEQLPFQLAADLPAGLYFARLGFFDPDTNQRLPAYSPAQQPLGDEFIAGPLYLSAQNVNPIKPQHPIQAQLGKEFELLGYSLYPAEDRPATEVELYWKTDSPVDVNYTVFVQWLNPQNQVMAQADAQPLPNLYPTSRWQPGDVITERFVLPVAAGELSGAGKLVTGMYDLSSGVRLSAYTQQGDLLPDGLIYLIN